MNGYRITGDSLHVLAIVILFVKFLITRSANGLSGKTQLLLAMTYIARYFDLWGQGIWISYYNTTLKVLYIVVSVQLTYITLHKKQDRENDTFRIEALLIPVTILALFFNYENSLSEILWSWSIFMEAVALIPQFYIIWKTKMTDSYVILYLLCMALYRAFYIGNWVYRYKYEGFYDIISAIGGVTETIVGIVGFISVVSIYLRGIRTECVGKPKSVYIIPLIPDELLKPNLKTFDSSKTKPNSKGNFHLPV